MRFWGFKYIPVFVMWRKINNDGKVRKGMGFYSRSAYEFLLLGSLGTTMPLCKP